MAPSEVCARFGAGPETGFDVRDKGFMVGLEGVPRGRREPEDDCPGL